jgi:hypothetical protein
MRSIRVGSVGRHVELRTAVRVDDRTRGLRRSERAESIPTAAAGVVRLNRLHGGDLQGAIGLAANSISGVLCMRQDVVMHEIDRQR